MMDKHQMKKNDNFQFVDLLIAGNLEILELKYSR